MNIDHYLEIITILDTKLTNPSKEDINELMNDNKDIDAFSYTVQKDILINKDIDTYDFDLHCADIILNIESNVDIKIMVNNKILNTKKTIPIISLKDNIEFKANFDNDKIEIKMFVIKLNKVPSLEFKYYNKRMITNNDGLKIVKGNLD